MFTTNFKSVLELLNSFPTEQSCIDYLEQIRWMGKPVSPYDETSEVYKCADNIYKCKNTKKKFNVLTGTMYENTKLPLQKWFLSVWLITCHKKGISSMQLAKDIDVTQKTAWFLLQRIRACFGIENYNELDGIVEADETFYGGKNKNRHRNKKAPKSLGRAFVDKVPIVGLLQRNGKITVVAVENTKLATIQPIVFRYVSKDATLITDDWKGYNGLGRTYDHRIIKDVDKGYQHDYDRDTHTNHIEGSWKILKNCIRDNYNNVSRKHIQAYVDEFVYRYNMRKFADSDKFNWLLINAGTRTKYKDLVNEQKRIE